MMTPYDKLKSIDNAGQYLKTGMSFLKLDAIANQVSDYEAARQLQVARKQLLKPFFDDRNWLGKDSENRPH